MARPRVLLASVLTALVAFSAPVLASGALPPWSGLNPGEADLHAMVADPALENNQALSQHPPADVPPADGGQPDALPDEANDHADEHYPPETGGGDGGNDDGGADSASANGATTAYAPQPTHWNVSKNGTFGGANWTWSNRTFTIEEGNFSWKGINCSWEAFTWTAGENPLDIINLTCTLWDIITVTLSNGTVTVTWSNGSWNYSFMPAGGDPLTQSGAYEQLAASWQAQPAAAPTVAKPLASPVVTLRF